MGDAPSVARPRTLRGETASAARSGPPDGPGASGASWSIGRRVPWLDPWERTHRAPWFAPARAVEPPRARPPGPAAGRSVARRTGPERTMGRGEYAPRGQATAHAARWTRRRRMRPGRLVGRTERQTRFRLGGSGAELPMEHHP